MSQLPHVSTKYGAPMGRNSLVPFRFDPAPNSTRCFRVHIDSQGYDDGGAYWGLGEPLYCLTNDADYREFYRAPSRFAAFAISDLTYSSLKVKPVDRRYTVTAEWYGAAKPGFVSRFCGDWIGVYNNKDEAWAKCGDHWKETFYRVRR